MTSLDLNTIEDIVNEIVVEIFEATKCEHCHLVVSSNGFMHYIEFAGFPIWDSETDGEFTHYQEKIFEKMLRDRLNLFFTMLSKVKL